MAGAASDGGNAPDNAQGMLNFLEGVLSKLELAQGCIDEEARQGLELLRQKTQELEAAKVQSSQALLEACAAPSTTPAAASSAATSSSAAMPVPSNADIATKLDSLQGDLSSLEAKLDGMDDAVARSLVAHSASLWLGDSPAVPQPQQPQIEQ